MSAKAMVKTAILLAIAAIVGSSNVAFAQATTNRQALPQALPRVMSQAIPQVLPQAFTRVLPQALPQVSTGSVDINCVDMPFVRSNGGYGAFGSGGADGGAGSSNGGTGSGAGAGMGGGAQQMPDLPPGWIGVTNTHTGAYMGAIPPGGNLYDFFNGKYGIVPGQEAEAAWIRDNQLQQAYDSGMFDGMGAWGPGGP